MHKTTDEGWDPLRLVILDLSTQFYMHETTGDVWDTYRLAILALNLLFCMKKTEMKARAHMHFLFWC